MNEQRERKWNNFLFWSCFAPSLLGGSIQEGLTAKEPRSKEDEGTEKELTMQEPDARTNEVAQMIVNAAIYVHRELGNGLLESAYELCLGHVLRKRGLQVEQQVPMPVIFDGVNLGTPYRIDLLVERLVVVELKIVDRISPIHEAQLISYLRLGNFHLGLLLNFRAALMKDGIMRRLNPVWDPAASCTIANGAINTQ